MTIARRMLPTAQVRYRPSCCNILLHPYNITRNKMMKHGVIVQFRISTEDVMSCVDVLNMSDVSKEGMSLSMLCKLVLSSYLHRIRTDGVIPTRGGFEYSSMIAPFVNVSQTKRANMADVMPRNTSAQPISHVYAQPGQQFNTTPRQQFNTTPRQQFNVEQYNDRSDILAGKRGRVEMAIEELEQRRMIDELNFTQAQTDRLVSLHAALVQLNNDVDVDIRTLLE